MTKSRYSDEVQQDAGAQTSLRGYSIQEVP